MGKVNELIERIDQLMAEQDVKRPTSRLNIADLLNSTDKFRPGKVKLAQASKISIVKISPVVSNKTLTISAKVLGTHTYKVTIMFSKVNFSDVKDSKHTFRVRENPDLFIEPIKTNKNPVAVRGACTDFQFAFSEWNKQHHALLGRPHAPYVRKTPIIGGRPPVNPKHLPGLCKHLIGFVKKLLEIGLLVR